MFCFSSLCWFHRSDLQKYFLFYACVISIQNNRLFVWCIHPEISWQVFDKPSMHRCYSFRWFTWKLRSILFSFIHLCEILNENDCKGISVWKMMKISMKCSLKKRIGKNRSKTEFTFQKESHSNTKTFFVSSSLKSSVFILTPVDHYYKRAFCVYFKRTNE